MRNGPAPCAKCPWTQPGRPDISPEIEAAAKAGLWFCCHVNMGTCFGAKAVSDRAARKQEIAADVRA